MQLSWAITMQISRVKPGNQREPGGGEREGGGGREGGREGVREEGSREGGNPS